jgi:hypothetical protein
MIPRGNMRSTASAIAAPSTAIRCAAASRRAPWSHGMTRPNIASADARLLALCREFHRIHDLVAQADAGEIDIDDDALTSALTRYWMVVGQIANAEPATDKGREQKVRAAYVAILALEETSPRQFFLARSALSDLVRAWDAGKAADAELLAACKEFQGIDAKVQRANGERGLPDGMMDKLLDGYYPALERLSEITARTNAGRHAKAAAAYAALASVYAREPASDEETKKGIWREELVALAALRDIAGSDAP